MPEARRGGLGQLRSRRIVYGAAMPGSPARLHDITNAALERRRRERAERGRQTNANPASWPVTTPAVDEMNASEHNTPVGEALPSDVSDASPSPAALATLSSLTPSSSDTLSTTERVPADPSTEDPKPTEFEKKLQSTISALERLVLDNLNRSPKKLKRSPKKATHILMSMR